MSPSGQSNLLLIRRLLHPSTPDFDPIRGRFFAQVSGREKPQPEIAHQRIAMRGTVRVTVGECSVDPDLLVMPSQSPPRTDLC